MFSPPSAHPGIRIVRSFAELVDTPFGGDVNALCWARTLPGDFAEVVRQLGPVSEITTLDEEDLMTLSLSAAGRAARSVLIDDLRRLTDAGLAPSLDCIPAYPRSDAEGPMPVDVYSFHVDSAPVPTDTYLCSYTEAASQGLHNADARRRVDQPATRAKLRQCFGGADDDGFREYLAEHCYDLHYEAIAGAPPFDFGLGNLWRIANACPGGAVPPCIHRAPATVPGRPPRLLLIS